MFTIILDFVFLVFCQMHIPPSLAIVNGTNVTTPKPYYVYLVKATLSERNYDHWLCGGAIVTKDFVITSAACVEDVDYLYVIAGYNKYIVDEELEIDECTKKMKKRVIYTCVPVSYNFDFDLLQKWSHIDIALAKVESAYDFEDPMYEQFCSYKPAIIPINYDPKYQITNIDSMVMGFGHRSIWRQHGDLDNYNSPSLLYAPTLIMDKKDCMKEYEVYPNMTYIIEQYMICTLDKGNIGDGGEPISEDFTKMEGCPPAKTRKQGTDDLCEDYNDKEFDFRRKSQTKRIYNYTTYEYIRRAIRLRHSNFTRRNGICQNDHGGPLVTWVGSREVLIGVASVFKVTEENECIGPFLYTSTQCNSAFLDCVLNNQYWIDKTGATKLSPTPPDSKPKYRRRLDLCDSPPSVKGFDIVRNHISWKDHPSGPVQDEARPDRQGFQTNVMREQENVEPNQHSVYQEFSTNYEYSGQQYQTNEEFLRQQQATYLQNAERQKNAAKEQHAVRQEIIAGEEHTATKKNSTQQFTASQKHLRIGNINVQNGANQQFDPDHQNPVNSQFDRNQQNPTNIQFNSYPPNSASGQFQPNQQRSPDVQFHPSQQNGMYAFNQQNTGNRQLNANQKNVANRPYAPNTGNGQFMPNPQVVTNEQFAPHQQITGNEQFVPNQQNVANGQNVYNLQNTAKLQFAPNTGNNADVRNAANQQNVVNKHYTANQQVVGKQVITNTQNVENIQYYIRDRYHPEVEGFPSDYRIPQERYQGSRMVARIGDEFGDSNYGLVNKVTMQPQNLPYGYG